MGGNLETNTLREQSCLLMKGLEVLNFRSHFTSPSALKLPKDGYQYVFREAALNVIDKMPCVCIIRITTTPPR